MTIAATSRQSPERELFCSRHRLRRVRGFWRSYAKVGGGALAFLVGVTALIAVLGGDGYGLFWLTYFWLVACVIAGALLLVLTLLLRFAKRIAKPS